VPEGRTWTFLTNHANVLFCIERDNSARIRDIAERVGITERAAQKILRDLEQEGYISVAKRGRRNTYRVHTSRPLRHSFQKGYSVGDLLHALPPPPQGGRPSRRRGER
jgi:predicted ArsR family transcriptional regulator